MNTKNLNIELLKSLDACESGINFVKRANLEGFPLSKLDQVEGDYDGFVHWLRQELKTVRVYNDQGLMTKRVNPLGRVCEYEYNDQGLMTKRVNPLGDVYRYKYNDKGLITKEVYPSGDVYEYEYEFDNKDRLFSITGRSQLKKGRSDLKIPEW